jgi:hypothetical protein
MNGAHTNKIPFAILQSFVTRIGHFRLALQDFSINFTCVARDVPDCVPAFVMEVMLKCAVTYNFFFSGESCEIPNRKR